MSSRGLIKIEDCNRRMVKRKRESGGSQVVLSVLLDDNDDDDDFQARFNDQFISLTSLKSI